jgi:hypothetical protein
MEEGRETTAAMLVEVDRAVTAAHITGQIDHMTNQLLDHCAGRIPTANFGSVPPTWLMSMVTSAKSLRDYTMENTGSIWMTFIMHLINGMERAS